MNITRRAAICTIPVYMTLLAGCTSSIGNETSAQDGITDSQNETPSSGCGEKSGKSLRIIPDGITVLIEEEHNKEKIYNSVDILEININVQSASESDTGTYVTITAYELTEGDVQALFNRAENLNVRNIRSGVHPGIVNRIINAIRDRAQISNRISNQDIQYTDEIRNGEQKIYAASNKDISNIMPLVNEIRIVSKIGNNSKILLNSDDFYINDGVSITPLHGDWMVTMNLNDQGKSKFANEIEKFYSEESRDHIQLEINGDAVGKYRVTNEFVQSVTGGDWDKELDLVVQTEYLKDYVNLPLLKMSIDIISCQ